MVTPPMRISRKLFAAGAAAILATITVGCSSTSDPDDPDNRIGPLDLMYLEAIGQSDELQESADDLETAVDTAIMTCMKDAGFDYIPLAQSSFVLTSSSVSDTQTLELARKNGYAIASEAETKEDDPSKIPTDYYDALTDAQRAAYDKALFGDPLSVDTATDSPENESIGCQEKALRAVLGDTREVEQRYQTLVAQIDAVYETVTKDSRYSELMSDWSTCMSDKGFSYATQDEAETHFIKEVESALTEPDSQQDRDSALDAVKKDEIATAIADAQCAGEIDMDDRIFEISREKQQSFIDANRVELTNYFAALAKAAE